jgi:hypothetical protein
MAENFASAMHNADNPFNLQQLLNVGLQTVAGRIAPAVIPSSQAPPVLTTPGASTPAPNPQVGEAMPFSERVKQFLPIVIVVAVLIGFVGWVLRKA